MITLSKAGIVTIIVCIFILGFFLGIATAMTTIRDTVNERLVMVNTSEEYKKLTEGFSKTTAECIRLLNQCCQGSENANSNVRYPFRTSDILIE